MLQKRKSRLIAIQKEIMELKKPVAPDNLIGGYKDFLQHRDYLHCYQYNSAVLESLLELTLALWHSDKRINRLSLLTVMRRYAFRYEKNTRNSPPMSQADKKNSAIAQKIFQLFVCAFQSPNPLPEGQREYTKRICNTMLKEQTLDYAALTWLCDHAAESELILNRLLRYPEKSERISKWAEENFNAPLIRLRRPEITGWVLDRNPEFELSNQTLIDDFEWANEKDVQTIKNHEDEIGAAALLNEELDGIIPSKFDMDPWLGDISGEPDFIISRPREPHLVSRHYPVPVVMVEDYHRLDLEKLRDKFYGRIDSNLKVTMLWSIAYSRLDKVQKTELMKKYYSEETYYTFFKICSRYGMKELLIWLKEQQ